MEDSQVLMVMAGNMIGGISIILLAGFPNHRGSYFAYVGTSKDAKGGISIAAIEFRGKILAATENVVVQNTVITNLQCSGSLPT